MAEPTNAELATQLHCIASSIERCTELPIADVQAIRLAATRLTQPVGEEAIAKAAAAARRQFWDDPNYDQRTRWVAIARAALNAAAQGKGE